MSGLIEAAVLNFVRAVTAEYETLLTSHVHAAVQSAMHKAAPTTLATGRPPQIYKHYKTGSYYRKLFHTAPGVTAPGDGPFTILLFATISTNDPTTNGARVRVYHTGTSEMYAAVSYDAIVYVSLTDGEIYIREQKEFEGLVGMPDRPCDRMVPRFMPVDFVPVANSKSWDPSAEDRK